MDIWENLSTIPSRNYICGHCGNDITSNLGYYLRTRNVLGYNGRGFIYICHKCNKPTYIAHDEQVPGATYGKTFDKEIFKNEIVYELYEEARKCMMINAYTSVGMCCRKLLMHIAVECGADENMKFIEYVDYLNDNGYVPVNSKSWVDIIRSKGNDANHKIIILNETDAKQLIIFIQNIITMIYEMPYQANLYKSDLNEKQ